MSYPHRIIERKLDSVTVEVLAWDNKKKYHVTLPSEGYDSWMRGQVIRAAFPSLHVDTRELLISGTSPEDLHGIFKEPG